MSNAQLETDITLLETYIEDSPVLYRYHINHLLEDILSRCGGYDLVTELVYAALDYTEARCRLEATTDNLARHDLRTSDMESLTSALLQNKEAAWRRYNSALSQYKARQVNRTRPLQPIALNW
jgi:hypothetical protein